MKYACQVERQKVGDGHNVDHDRGGDNQSRFLTKVENCTLCALPSVKFFGPQQAVEKHREQRRSAVEHYAL